MDGLSRRQALRTTGLVVLGALAGCSDATASGERAGETTGPATRTETRAANETVSGATSSVERRRYRADQRGGPDDLLRDPTIRAISIPGYDGPAPYVFTPAILWVETGSTVTWNVEGGSHAIAAYHPDNDHSLRIPADADPFDSDLLQVGDSFSYTFETPGVYDYLCRPHEPYGMVGLVVAGGAHGGPGTADGANVALDVAGEHLTRLLELADIEVTRATG